MCLSLGIFVGLWLVPIHVFECREICEIVVHTYTCTCIHVFESVGLWFIRLPIHVYMYMCLSLWDCGSYDYLYMYTCV